MLPRNDSNYTSPEEVFVSPTNLVQPGKKDSMEDGYCVFCLWLFWSLAVLFCFLPWFVHVSV